MEPMKNFKNRTVWIRDNIQVLRRINSSSIDLIYLDPPFNSKANYAAPIGSKAAGAAFKDTWSLSDVDVEWTNLLEAKHPTLYRVILAAMTDSDRSYLTYMAERLLELRRILNDSGSIYLHCDPTMSHYLKLVMDAIFGRGNFRNEIVWCYRGGGVPKLDFARKHDTLLRYSYGRAFTFNVDAVRIPYSGDSLDRLTYTARSFRSSGTYDNYKPNPDGKHPEDWWTLQPIMPSSKERTGYPTQKPKALLQRIIRASSNKGDIVLDPFAGCATTCVVAEDEGRQWIGIDISDMAGRLVRERLHDPKYKTFYPDKKIFVRDSDLPTRSDLGPLPHHSTHRKTLYGEQEGNCQGCREHFQLRNLEVDHIIARASGGTDEVGNLQLLCGYCNKVKGNRGMPYLKAKLQLT